MSLPISPLTGTNNVLKLDSIKVERIIEGYQRLQIDVRSYFKSYKEIHLYRCLETGYEFFYPMDITGDDLFYQQLQRNDWYYNPWKWEHKIASNYLLKNDKVLEVGCGPGTFLQRIKEKVLDTCGLELNLEAINIATKNGVNVFSETVQDHSSKRSECYDVVCSFQVLEHIADPHSFISAMVSSLKPGGRLIIAVPNNDAFIKWDSQDWLNAPPHHMGRWSINSLKSIEQIFNIKLHSVLFEPVQQYHLQWFASLWVEKFIKLKWVRSAFYRFRLINLLKKLIPIFNPKGHTIMVIFKK